VTVVLALVVGWVIVNRRSRSRSPQPPLRLILIVVLVEIRNGRSILSALQTAAGRLPGNTGLVQVARLASVAGLTVAVRHSPESLRPALYQLARAQRTGASLSETVRRIIDDDLAEERARRLARARSLPPRLMVPVTLFMLPGLVILLYAPSVLALFDEMLGGMP
jgi:hypothetical protein